MKNKLDFKWSKSKKWRQKRKHEILVFFYFINNMQDIFNTMSQYYFSLSENFFYKNILNTK